jgi:hypothetical protein
MSKSNSNKKQFWLKRLTVMAIASVFALLALDGQEASAVEYGSQVTEDVASCKYSVTAHAKYNADVQEARMRGLASPSKPYPYSARFGSCVQRNWTFANCAGMDMMTTCAARVAKVCCH